MTSLPFVDLSDVQWEIMCHANSQQRARTIQSILQANDIPTTIREEIRGLETSLRAGPIQLFPVHVPLRFLQQAKDILRRFGQVLDS